LTNLGSLKITKIYAFFESILHLYNTGTHEMEKACAQKAFGVDVWLMIGGVLWGSSIGFQQWLTFPLAIG
jgi:hypothetical protein